MVDIISIIISSPRQWLECLASALKIHRGGTCPKMQNVWQFGRVSHFDSLHSPKTECYGSGKRWRASSFSLWALCILTAGGLDCGKPLLYSGWCSLTDSAFICVFEFTYRTLTSGLGSLSMQPTYLWLDPALGSTLYPFSFWLKCELLIYNPQILVVLVFLGSSADKESACSAGDWGSVPGLERRVW